MSSKCPEKDIVVILTKCDSFKKEKSSISDLKAICGGFSDTDDENFHNIRQTNKESDSITKEIKINSTTINQYSQQRKRKTLRKKKQATTKSSFAMRPQAKCHKNKSKRLIQINESTQKYCSSIHDDVPPNEFEAPPRLQEMRPVRGSNSGRLHSSPFHSSPPSLAPVYKNSLPNFKTNNISTTIQTGWPRSYNDSTSSSEKKACISYNPSSLPSHKYVSNVMPETKNLQHSLFPKTSSKHLVAGLRTTSTLFGAVSRSSSSASTCQEQFARNKRWDPFNQDSHDMSPTTVGFRREKEKFEFYSPISSTDQNVQLISEDENENYGKEVCFLQQNHETLSNMAQKCETEDKKNDTGVVNIRFLNSLSTSFSKTPEISLNTAKTNVDRESLSNYENFVSRDPFLNNYPEDVASGSTSIIANQRPEVIYIDSSGSDAEDNVFQGHNHEQLEVPCQEPISRGPRSPLLVRLARKSLTELEGMQRWIISNDTDEWEIRNEPIAHEDQQEFKSTDNETKMNFEQVINNAPSERKESGSTNYSSKDSKEIVAVQQKQSDAPIGSKSLHQLFEEKVKLPSPPIGNVESFVRPSSQTPKNYCSNPRPMGARKRKSACPYQITILNSGNCSDLRSVPNSNDSIVHFPNEIISHQSIIDDEQENWRMRQSNSRTGELSDANGTTENAATLYTSGSILKLPSDYEIQYLQELAHHKDELHKCECGSVKMYPMEVTHCLKFHKLKKCWLCLQNVVYRKGSLTNHNKKFHDKATKCPFCTTQLNLTIELRNHIEREHFTIPEEHLSKELPPCKSHKKKKCNEALQSTEVNRTDFNLCAATSYCWDEGITHPNREDLIQPMESAVDEPQSSRFPRPLSRRNSVEIIGVREGVRQPVIVFGGPSIFQSSARIEKDTEFSGFSPSSSQSYFNPPVDRPCSLTDQSIHSSTQPSNMRRFNNPSIIPQYPTTIQTPQQYPRVGPQYSSPYPFQQSNPYLQPKMSINPQRAGLVQEQHPFQPQPRNRNQNIPNFSGCTIQNSPSMNFNPCEKGNQHMYHQLKQRCIYSLESIFNYKAGAHLTKDERSLVRKAIKRWVESLSADDNTRFHKITDHIENLRLEIVLERNREDVSFPLLYNSILTQVNEAVVLQMCANLLTDWLRKQIVFFNV